MAKQMRTTIANAAMDSMVPVDSDEDVRRRFGESNSIVAMMRSPYAILPPTHAATQADDRD